MALKLAVFVSDSSRLLDAILSSSIAVHLVLADRDCPAFERAVSLSESSHVMLRHAEANLERYTRQILQVLEQRAIDIVAMAGFAGQLGLKFYKTYANRIIISHHWFLPEFKGENSVRDVLASGTGPAGCTIQYATALPYAGPILAQRSVPIWKEDDEERLRVRIEGVEEKLFPAVIHNIVHKASDRRRVVAAF